MPTLDTIIKIFEVVPSLWLVLGVGLVCLIWEAILVRKAALFCYFTAGAGFLAALYLEITHLGQTGKFDILVRGPFDGFFLILLYLAGFLGLVLSYGYLKSAKAFSQSELDPKDPDLKDVEGVTSSAYASLILFAVGGMGFFILSDHLLVTFIALEIFSLAIYILTGSHRKSLRSSEAALKYFVLGSMASAVLLFGIVLFFAGTASLEISQLENAIIEREALGSLIDPKFGLILIGVGIFFKLGLAPFHFWIPDVYQGAPSPVVAFMSTSVKVAAIGFLFKFLDTLVLVLGSQNIVELFWWLAIISMAVGHLGALVQDNVKRMLAYSSIAHAGFLILALVGGFQSDLTQGGEQVFDQQVISQVGFYLLSYVFMNVGAFACLSFLRKDKQEAVLLSDLRGLYKTQPVVAAFFSLVLISLLGIPGTIGFIAKYGVLLNAVEAQYYHLAILAILGSVVSVAYYLRPIASMYFRKEAKASDALEPIRFGFSNIFVFVCCAFCLVYLGLKPDDIIHLTQSFLASL